MKPRRYYGCPVEFSLDVLGGKWKTVILSHLKQGPMRYGELRKAIPELSDKVLTERLRALCGAGLAEVSSDDGVARRYQITETGASLGPVLQALYDWGQARAVVTGVRIQGREPHSQAPLRGIAATTNGHRHLEP